MATPITNQLTFAAYGGSTPYTGLTVTSTGDTQQQVAVPVPASTTNQALLLSIIPADLQSIFLYTDGPLTVKVNSSGSPAFTWVFSANNPLTWNALSPLANPLSTTTVTEFFLTNTSAATVNLYGIILQQV